MSYAADVFWRLIDAPFATFKIATLLFLYWWIYAYLTSGWISMQRLTCVESFISTWNILLVFSLPPHNRGGRSTTSQSRWALYHHTAEADALPPHDRGGRNIIIRALQKLICLSEHKTQRGPLLYVLQIQAMLVETLLPKVGCHW